MTNMQISTDVSIVATQSLKEKSYWRQNLNGELKKSCFPFDYKNIKTKQGNVKKISFALTEELVEQLMKLSNGSDSRLHMILVAAVNILLKIYTGNTDIIVGTTIDRQGQEREFINTILPLRNNIEDHMTFKELLTQMRETIFGAIEHQNYPMESLLNDLNMAYSEDEFPLFDVMVLLENIHDRKYLQHIPVNIVFYFNRTGEGIECHIEYNGFLYEDCSIGKIIKYFLQILRQTLFEVQKSLIDIEILDDEEKNYLLFQLNYTAVAYPPEKHIQDLFEGQVKKTPFQIAIVDGQRFITYAELNKKSNQLAHLLVSRGVIGGSIVGLLAERSIELITGIWGILKAGGAYLPFDPYSPNARIEFMLKDSNSKLILTTSKILAEIEVIDYIKEPILLDDTAIFQGDTRNPGNTGNNDLAYIIYTSGTTGKPKGVLIDQMSLVNYISWAVKKYIQGEPINFPFYTSVSFDLTVTSIFTPLVTGNKVYVYMSDANELLLEKVLKENKVEAIKLTPSHLKLILNSGNKWNESNLKRFIVGGEELESQLADDIAAAFNGNIEIYNEYGPTETTVGCMIYQHKPNEDKGRIVPIGTPADNVQIYLLDRNQKTVPIGANGEIYISGDGVARGYLNRPELTAEKFINNPFLAGKKMYRSGDTGRYLENGTMQFLGRTDEQVNIRGFRVELGEIKAQLLNHEQIKDVVVNVIKDDGKNRSLCAYIVTVSGAPIDVPELKTYLSKAVPNYMIPAYYIYLKEIHLTANGKINKKALPDPFESMKRNTQYVPPQNENEKKLVEIWQKELKLEKIGINDNFFNIGGDSIKAISLMNSINKTFDLNLKLVHLYQNETIVQLAIFIDRNKTNDLPLKYVDILEEFEGMKNEFLERERV